MDRIIKRFDILGVKISAIDIEDTVSIIEEAIRQRGKIHISVCPVSTIMACKNDDGVLESVNSADLVTPDGMPVVWIGRLKGFQNIKRVYGPDLMLEICRLSEKKFFRNYFYGSTHSVLERMKGKLMRMFPKLLISGMYSPPFRNLLPDEDKVINRMIDDANPDILWVGLGSPKQDTWMYEHRERLNVPVMIGVGAAFDFIAGTKKQAPKWMQIGGLEWLFRLISEPKRLWKRYILGNALFLYLLILDFIKHCCKFYLH